MGLRRVVWQDDARELESCEAASDGWRLCLRSCRERAHARRTSALWRPSRARPPDSSRLSRTHLIRYAMPQRSSIGAPRWCGMLGVHAQAAGSGDYGFSCTARAQAAGAGAGTGRGTPVPSRCAILAARISSCDFMRVGSLTLSTLCC